MTTTHLDPGRPGEPAHPAAPDLVTAQQARGRDLPPAWGWPARGGGRAANVEPGMMWQATTSQVCGLFPFAVAGGAAPRGVPVGRHLHTGEPVGLDPAHWLRSGLVSNTGMWIQGQPGIGKSTIVKRLLTGLVAFGATAVIPGDVKGEYTALVEHLGGTVWRLGRGHHSLNPLDAGPLRAALRAAVGTERTQLVETIRTRRLSLLEALIVIVRRGPITVTERRLLDTALDTVRDHTTTADGRADDGEPVIGDILNVLTSPPASLLAVTAADTETRYRREARDLVNTLALLCTGAMRGLFDRPSTVTTDLDTPALSLDISALDHDDDDVVAAAMLSAWAWAASAITAAGARGHHRTVFRVQDELWRALRVAPGLVELSDRVTRLGRSRGEISAQVTHSLDDLDALPTPEDRAKARGLAGRNAITVLGGMNTADLDRLHAITPLSDAETAMVHGWAAPPTWVPGQLHPGRGKYLIKSGGRTGLPIHLSLTSDELDLYHTEHTWHPPRHQH
ncbi:helicase HerA domain-containing protein [Pseudonocardia sp. ICBG1142]|uniref:helicase HerA domain-containing protein n=1 Tax=Pseudonocardia sp. ICBG1142 TaxID=2846760 RepID=UPI001CF6C017|nr:DUF87 domain-containing protein [Pseudonocardia sp. ICBG1142]